MAADPIGILGPFVRPDSAVLYQRLDQVMNSPASSPSIADQYAFVVPDGGDYGVHGNFEVPASYVQNPSISVACILLAAGANNLALAARVAAPADTEDMNITLGTADVTVRDISAIGDNGLVKINIPITTAMAVDDEVVYWIYRQNSGSTFTGDIGLLGARFVFDDA